MSIRVPSIGVFDKCANSRSMYKEPADVRNSVKLLF